MTSGARSRDVEIVIPPVMQAELKSHLLTDRSREQMAILLCGISRVGKKMRLLGRHLVTMPPAAFAHQSAGGLTLAPEVQQHVLRLAARENLSQVDFHTHPGEGMQVTFSRTDDENEAALARYLAERMPGTHYASVVLNPTASVARIWTHENREPVATEILAPDLRGCSSESSSGSSGSGGIYSGRFDRQVRAFGHEFQRRLQQIRVGLVGVGGLGSILVEELARLGVHDWVLVDPDKVEVSNLNRLLGATLRDAEEEVAKVAVALRTIRQSEPRAKVKTFRTSVFTPRALGALKSCDLLVAATDNDASRLVVNALACQYLIPLVHLGVNLAPKPDGGFEDISGEVAIPSLGEWCLLCGGMVSTERAGWDMARPEERALLTARGYLEGTPAPAVYYLNSLVASLAAAEIHCLVWPYRPLHRYVVFRELACELLEVHVPVQEHCLHCGAEGRLGLGDLVPIWRPALAQSLAAMNLPSADPVGSET
jgi:molybdopterin-synthase adenylyltransferase